MGRAFAVKAVHKKTYPSLYNFRGDAVGTTDSDIGFVENITANSTATILAEFDGHRHVLEWEDTAGGGNKFLRHYLAENHVSGTYEFWWGTDDKTEEKTLIFASSAWASGVYLKIKAGTYQYRNAVPADVDTTVALIDGKVDHHKIVFDCTTDTFDWYINGDSAGAGLVFNGDVDNFRYLQGVMDGLNYKVYFDAIGASWDANYKIGDNVFWRHYKESTDSFEGDDVGTQGTSITWVDTASTADDHEIIAEFNEHKKILRTYRNSGVGLCSHSFASQSTAGWLEGWIKVADANADNNFIDLREDAARRIWVRIDNDRFEYDAGAGMVDAGCPVVDATRYHLFLQWYADNTFDLWVNNVQYLDGVSTHANFTGSGINYWYIFQSIAGAKYIDLDAPMSSLDSDVKADNRIFDYNSTYTSEDITSTIINVEYKNELGKWRTGLMTSQTSYENSEIFVQVYDVNSVLAMEADLKKRDQVEGGMKYEYPLRDKNQDDLEHRSSNRFNLDDIHDPTDSTCILKTILPNVGEEDGDLLLVDADTKATTYSPVTKNYPDYLMLRDVADLADCCVIVHADGKCFMDDDKASGTTLDYDTSADFDKMTKPILVTDILETINYFEIFGAINPETGARFYKIIDNTGEDKKRTWRYTNNEFRSQTDVDNYASALEARTATIKLIKFTAQSLGAHNMGETINYKYVSSPYNVPQANYYIIYEEIDFDTNENIIILSEGMIEESKYAAAYERPENYNDSFAAEIYETDLVTIHPTLKGNATITEGYLYLIMNAPGEEVLAHFYIEPEIDEGRDVTMTFLYSREDGNNDTITMQISLNYIVCDGTETDWTNVWALAATTLPADALNEHNKKIFTIDSGDVAADSLYRIEFNMNEAGRTVHFYAFSVKYYLKRKLT